MILPSVLMCSQRMEVLLVSVKNFMTMYQRLSQPTAYGHKDMLLCALNLMFCNDTTLYMGRLIKLCVNMLTEIVIVTELYGECACCLNQTGGPRGLTTTQSCPAIPTCQSTCHTDKCDIGMSYDLALITYV